MKYFTWIVIFLLVLSGLGFYLMKDLFGTEELHYDDDQEGINEQITIRFSHVVAENTPKGLAAQKFAELVQEKSNGRVRVEVFPNGALASDQEEFTALLQNDVQIIAPSFSKMTEISLEWALFDLPFLFADEEEVESAFVGEIGAHLLGSLETEGMKGLALWGNGFKQMTSERNPLVQPVDFKNQRFRIMPSWIIEEQFKSFDAKPVALSFNDVYDSLESQRIDGQENTFSNISSRRMYELQRYMTVSDHGYLGYGVIMNGDFWSQLPEDVQTVVTEAMVEATGWNLAQSKQLNNELLKEFKGYHHLEIHYLTEEEKQKWEAALQPVYQTFKEKVSRKLVELVTAI